MEECENENLKYVMFQIIHRRGQQTMNLSKYLRDNN